MGLQFNEPNDDSDFELDENFFDVNENFASVNGAGFSSKNKNKRSYLIRRKIEQRIESQRLKRETDDFYESWN